MYGGNGKMIRYLIFAIAFGSVLQGLSLGSSIITGIWSIHTINPIGIVAIIGGSYLLIKEVRTRRLVEKRS